MILGCGDIGQRLAQQTALADWRIIGVRRSLPNVEGPLSLHPSFSYRQADLTDLSQLCAILPEQLDYLVVTMTPSERSEAGYQSAYVDTAKVIEQALKQADLTPKRIIFVSSTSVYGQSNGETVDELSPAKPSSYAGSKLLEAEKVYNDSPFPNSLVRFSGIYGPGRFRLIEQALSADADFSETALTPQYSNRLHIEDCANILQHLLTRCERGEVLSPLYIGTDSEPSDLNAVRLWLRDQAQLQFDRLPALPAQKPSARKSGGYSRSSKRLSNQRLLDSGFNFSYPTYREGYQPVLDQYVEQYKATQATGKED